jgi:hypothetical protein
MNNQHYYNPHVCKCIRSIYYFSTIKFFINVAFTGDESSLLECKFNPWREHDCSAKEHAGVVCRDHPEIIHI